MDKQAIYRHVQSNITKPKRKGLAQGSVKAPHTVKAKTSHTLSNAHEDINSNQADTFHPCEKNSVRPKIICHAPNIVHTNIATKEHRTHIVPVDVPPTIYISADSAAHDSGIHNSDHQIDGGATDITASRQLYTENSILANSMKINPGSQNISLAPSCGQNAEKHTSKENVPDISETKQVIKRRKKPAGKVIQSRYMQASANSRKQTKSSKPKITSSMDKINTGGGHGSPMKSASLHHHHLLKTPPKSNRDNGLKAKASTPVAECKTFFESDMSTIQTTQCRKAPEQETHTDSSKPHVGHEDVTQTDLDLIFSSQLCSLYVHLRVKEAADKRHKKALQDLTKLSLTNVALEEEVANLEIEVLTQEHNQQLNDTIESQINDLGPVLNQLEETTEKYKLLAKNIDTTRHALPVSGAVVPDEDRLLRVLQQTNETVSEVTALTRTHEEPCNEAATYFTKLTETLSKEHKILNLAWEDLEEAKINIYREFNLKQQLKTDEMLAEF